MPVQVKGEVLDIRRVGSYQVLSLTAPGISDIARPGHFVTLGIGGEESSMLLRRAFAIHQVQSRGVYGGTLDVVIGVHGKGTRWLSERRRHDVIDIVGPLGRPFILQGAGGLRPRGRRIRIRAHVHAGRAPRAWLPRRRGRRRSDGGEALGVLELKRLASTLTITTDDGSLGERGRVTDVLPELMDRVDAALVYACGPMGMLQAVADMATARRIYSQCAVEEAMACGIGVCMTCVIPVVGEDGVTRMLRSCVEGPVFRGDRVRWSDVGTIPPDTLGAPVEGGH